MTNILEKTITSFNYFIKYIDENNIEIIIPNIQRPQAWDENKIKKILNLGSNDYFGALTLLKKTEKKFILIDGQQRLTNFLLMYKLVYDFKSSQILKSEHIDSKKRDCFKALFGNYFSRDEMINGFSNKKRENHFKEWMDYLKLLDLAPKFIFYKKNSEILFDALEKSFIALNVVDDINESDLFISLNNDSTPLFKSDILKAIFIKNHSKQNFPMIINDEWQKALISVKKMNPKKTANLDKFIIQFLSSQGVNIRGPQIVKHFDKKISKLESIDKKNRYIDEIVSGINKFVSQYAIPLSFKESKTKLVKKAEDLQNAIKFLFLSTKHYKSFLPYLFNIFKEGSSIISRKQIDKALLLCYFTHLNLFLNKNTINSLKFHRPPEIREKAISWNKEQNMNNFYSIVFSKWNFPNLNTNDLIDENVMENFVNDIIKIFIKSINGKTTRYIFEWYFSEEYSEIHDYLNNFTLEHVFEKVKTKEKKLDSWATTLLEKSIHKTMNMDIIKYNNQTKRANAKINFYKKSKSKFTNEYTIIKSKKEANIIFHKIYFSLFKDKIEKLIKSLLNNK